MANPKRVQVKLEWHPLGSGGDFGPQQTFRTPCVGGWLVCVERINTIDKKSSKQLSVTFVPDAQHQWVL